jgi:phage repressor protein C with HTH and peptisase S24 domain
MGEPVVNGDRFYDDGTGNLFIKRVQLDDEGEYACTATNPGGTASNVLKLDVLGNCFPFVLK